MSNMVERYLASKAQRPSEAKQIPGLATNFFDQQSVFQKGFTPFAEHGKPTAFTSNALNHYKAEIQQITIPDGFVPLEEGITLHRWSPSKKYYTPGAPGTEGRD